MGKYLSVLLSALVLAVLTFMVHTEAGAFADGNASCSNAENDVEDCGIFGNTGSVIEFTATSNDTCAVVAGAVPCTGYTYKYTGPTSNQLVLLIPKAVMTKFTSADATAAGCSQLITNFSGDPTTGFGKNDLLHYVCRTAPNLGPGATFTIHADRSAFAPTSWQVRISNNSIGAAVINGPSLTPAAVVETGATITSADGKTCQYTTVGGQTVFVDCPTGRQVPLNQSRLCLPAVGSQVPNLIDGSGSFLCVPIEFWTEGTDLKREGSETTCRSIGGRLSCF